VQVALEHRGQRQGRGGARADERAQQQRPDALGHPGRGQDVGGVDDRGGHAEQRPDGIERPGARAGEDEDEAGRGDDEGAGLAAAGPLAAERDGGHRDHRGEGVEQQRQQPGVEALQGGEVGPGLRAVAHGAQRERDADVAPGQQAHLARGARRDHQRPEERGREQEADGEQGADGGALVVGELAEDPHRAEGDGGGEADEGAAGGHGAIVTIRSFRNDSS
jgi:hypothetical protein